MTRRLLFAAALLITVLAGCTSAPEPAPAPTAAPPASAPVWTEPADYSFVVDRRCGDGQSLGRYRVVVIDGAVSSRERIDGRTAVGEEEVQVPTLSELLELASVAVEDGADATTAFDPADGHPVEVSINRSAEAAGGADCFRISEYVVTR